jgi:hypothetical protein
MALGVFNAVHNSMHIGYYKTILIDLSFDWLTSHLVVTHSPFS